MKIRLFASGVVVGAVLFYVAFLIVDARSARRTDFSRLVRDIHVTSSVGRVSPAGAGVPSRHIAEDLNIIFERYSALNATELAILRLVNNQVQSGTVVLPAKLSRDLHRRLGEA